MDKSYSISTTRVRLIHFSVQCSQVACVWGRMILAGLVTQAVVARTVLDRAIVRNAQGYVPLPSQILDDVEYLLQDTERVLQYERETQSMAVSATTRMAAAQQQIGREVRRLLPGVVEEMQRRTYRTPKELMVGPTVGQMLKWAPQSDDEDTTTEAK